MPRYPGADVVKAALDARAPASSAAFTTGDDIGKVASYFADTLAAQGWSTQRIDGPDGIMVFADKGARSATVVIASAEDKTTIDLLVIEMP